MILQRISAAAILALALSACAASGSEELVNITFVPSVRADEYRTWAFDHSACRDSGHPDVEDEEIRTYLLEEIERELVRLGFEHRPQGEVDCLVYYEVIVEPGPDESLIQGRVRGKIFVKDAATGKRVWRGERKAAIQRRFTGEEQRARVREFVQDILQYTGVR